ncbi:hypothetical protein [Halobacterium zhouii]|uniref:hypothetical protein n=1 Tax=Halobacterium zhouii TaxID=2902624 RepID=UPI001E37D347|nr:hypothetical protein [Halobacterium zhouii]
MARASVALGVLVLVVTAGCVTAEPAGVGPTATPTADHPFDLREAPGQTSDRLEDPWNADPIEVVVENSARRGRNVHPEVMRALSYWERNAHAYDTYTPEYRLVSQTDSPEIRVRVVRTIASCGEHTEGVVLGCAPTLTPNETVNGTTTIRIRAGHSQETTLAILKHEFGHTLGLDHDANSTVMSEDLAARAPESVIDAMDRRYPWAEGTVTVAAVSDHGVSETTRKRVKAALAYYQRGADGTVGSPPTFEYVENPHDADVVVDLRRSVEACDTIGPDHSCVDWRGPSVDDDPQPEYFTDARIAVGDTEKVGWHVGYWLGRSLWTNGVPMPFKNSSHPPATSW